MQEGTSLFNRSASVAEERWRDVRLICPRSVRSGRPSRAREQDGKKGPFVRKELKTEQRRLDDTVWESKDEVLKGGKGKRKSKGRNACRKRKITVQPKKEKEKE